LPSQRRGFGLLQQWKKAMSGCAPMAGSRSFLVGQEQDHVAPETLVYALHFLKRMQAQAGVPVLRNSCRAGVSILAA